MRTQSLLFVLLFFLGFLISHVSARRGRPRMIQSLEWKQGKNTALRHNCLLLCVNIIRSALTLLRHPTESFRLFRLGNASPRLLGYRLTIGASRPWSSIINGYKGSEALSIFNGKIWYSNAVTNTFWPDNHHVVLASFYCWVYRNGGWPRIAVPVLLTLKHQSGRCCKSPYQMTTYHFTSRLSLNRNYYRKRTIWTPYFRNDYLQLVLYLVLRLLLTSEITISLHRPGSEGCIINSPE